MEDGDRPRRFPYGSLGDQSVASDRLASRPRRRSRSIGYVRANDFKTAKQLMGVDQHPLNVGDRCRVSVFAISSEARRLRGDIGGRKASQETNWSRGTALARPEYRLQELGYGKKRPIFYRHELLGLIVNVERLRNNASSPLPKDQISALEDDTLAEIEQEAADAETAEQVKQAIDALASANDAQVLEAKVKKAFADGVLKGIVVRHVVLPLAMVGEGDVAAGERWLVRYENNKEELLMPQELLDILVAEVPKTKAKDDPLANDPLLGRKLRSPEAEDPDVGTVLSVVLKKPAGVKKKRMRYYTVEWRSPAGQVTLVREYNVTHDPIPLKQPKTSSRLWRARPRFGRSRGRTDSGTRSGGG